MSPVRLRCQIKSVCKPASGAVWSARVSEVCEATGMMHIALWVIAVSTLLFMYLLYIYMTVLVHGLMLISREHMHTSYTELLSSTFQNITLHNCVPHASWRPSETST